MWVHSKEKKMSGFPGGPVVKDYSRANAGGAGSILGPGRSHMLQSNESWGPQLLSLCSRAWEQQMLSPSAATTEILTPRAHALNKRGHHKEKPAHCRKEQPLFAATRESLQTARETQHSQK